MTFGECGDLRLDEDGTLSRIDRGGDGEDIRVRKLGAIGDIDARALRHEERADFAYLADLWADVNRDDYRRDVSFSYSLAKGA